MVTTPSFTGTCDKEFALTGTNFLQAQRGELITIKGTSVFFPSIWHKRVIRFSRLSNL